tara:strand:- start:2101 stop:4002 length:1902 start_codon:yes stop_codon:yes gene_type:complete
MEEKKLDLNTIIGFILIGFILLYMLWQQQPTAEELAAQEEAKQEQLESDSAQNKAILKTNNLDAQTSDYSLDLENFKNQVGDFAYAMTLPSATPTFTTFENQVLAIKIDNKGGFISEVKLKNYVNHNSDPVYLIRDGSSQFNLNFATSENRILNSSELYFQPTLSKSGDNQILSMRLKVSESQFLEYRYELKPNNHMLGFSVRSQGLSSILNTSQDVQLDWKFDAHRQGKSIAFENRYTRLSYEHEGDKTNKLSQTGDDDETETDVSWISFRQHFFSSILVPEAPFKTADLKSFNLINDEAVDTLFTKRYEVSLPLSFSGGELAHNMSIYYGPTYDKILNQYDKNLESSIPFGWGVIGWINKSVFSPLYGWLTNYLSYGLAIIVMTIIVKILLSFVQYKQFLTQAKNKIIKPELDAIRDKYKKDKMKAQKETMALQTRVGANPMSLSGCLPVLFQMPVFYSLFMFFPIAFELRQKPFLWVEDLSSYDSIAELPFYIPLYGDHISLFPILASIAIFFYMKMTTGQQMSAQPSQEGMPDMAKMMKYLIYFSPIMMLFFFNNYASGLSLYYFISNLISIALMLVIKNYIIDEKKVLAQIQVSKAKKPKKQTRFQKKMADIMEQAEAQKKIQQNRKK